jgi:hypothetical protein
VADVLANIRLARGKVFGQQLREGAASCVRGTPGQPLASASSGSASTSSPDSSSVLFDALILDEPRPLVGTLPASYPEAVAVFNAAMGERLVCVGVGVGRG